MKLLTFILTLIFIIFQLTGCCPRNGKNGIDGLNGTNGAKGKDGSNGSGCHVRQLVNGAEIVCDDLTSAVILNGLAGPKGEDMIAGQYSVKEIINPCSSQGDFDEILLKLENGQILAHYSDGPKQFLTLLKPRAYTTTDGFACGFTINQNYEVVW